MKRLTMALILLTLPGCSAMCGLSSTGNEATGQVKKVQHKTPLLCGEYDEVDVSLGVIRNGVGSMSTQDQWFNLGNNPEVLAIFKKASENGALVKFRYDERRQGDVCRYSDHYITYVEMLP
jgi:hypothetical protein